MPKNPYNELSKAIDEFEIIVNKIDIVKKGLFSSELYGLTEKEVNCMERLQELTKSAPFSTLKANIKQNVDNNKPDLDEEEAEEKKNKIAIQFKRLWEDEQTRKDMEMLRTITQQSSLLYDEKSTANLDKFMILTGLHNPIEFSDEDLNESELEAEPNVDSEQSQEQDPQIEPENINKPQENNNENPQEIKIENPQEQPENKIEDKPEIINEQQENNNENQPELKAKEEQKDILHADAPAQKKFTIAKRLKDAKLQSKNDFNEYVSFVEYINDLNKEKEEIEKSRPARNGRRSEKLNAQIEYIHNTTDALHSQQSSASQNLKESILEIQALLTLKETFGEEHEITQEDLDEAVKNEGFTAALLKAPDPDPVNNYSLIVDDPEKLHELSNEGSQLLPGVDKMNRWTTHGLFGWETPTPSDTNGYHTGRSAIDSFAMLYFADQHKKQINAGEYTINNFFSPEKLKERKKAYEEVWKKIKQPDHEWIAEHVYEGYLALRKLCEETAKQIDWTSKDHYRDEKYQMLTKAQYYLFDADQEKDDGCTTQMLRYIKEKYDPNLQITGDSKENLAALYKHWMDKKLTLPTEALVATWRFIYTHSARIMFEKKFKNDKIDIAASCQTVAMNMEAVIEISNRFIAHESVSKMLDSFNDLEPEKISEKAKYFGFTFTDEKIPEIFDKLDNESKQKIFDNLDNKSKQEIFDNLDNKSKQEINNDDQIRNIDYQLKIDPELDNHPSLEAAKNARISELIRQRPELIRMPSELISQHSKLIRPYAEKKFLTDLFPTVPEESKLLISGLPGCFENQFQNMRNVVKADPTGSVGRNMLNDILSGKFSEMNGGHEPVSEQNLKSANVKLKNPLNAKQLADKYKMTEQVKKDIWENELASDYLKFKHTACAFADDLQNEDERNLLSNYCTEDVLAGRKNRPQGQSLETKIANDYFKYKEKYKELNTKGQNPRFLGDGGKPIINDAKQLYSFDRDNQEGAYEYLKSNLQSDMRRDSDAKINKIRDTAIKLIDIPSEDYTRAMFRNSHLMEIEPLSSETLNIKVPSKTLRQELGKDTFNKLANIKIQANEEILTAVETEKLLARSSEEREKDKEAERKQLYKIWSVHRKTLLAYEALSRIDIDSFSTGNQKNRLSNDEGKMEPNKPAMLSNNLTELTENSKGTKSAIGWIRGEKKAIENGWGLEELGLLGMIGRLEEASKEALPETIKENEDTGSQRKEFHKAVLKLKEEVWFKPIRNNKDKKHAAQKIRQFITEQNKLNPLTPKMFNGLPMENINTALTAVDKLPDAAKAQNEFNDREQVTNHLNSAIKTRVPMRLLDALIEVSQKKKTNERDRFLSMYYEGTKHGKDYLQQLAGCLEESIGELKKNINERIDQVSQDLLEHSEKVPPEYQAYIGSNALRKQLALNSLRKSSDMIQRLNEYLELENDLLNSANLPEKLRNNMKIEIQKKRAQHAGDRSYQFNSEEKFSRAILSGGRLNLEKLKAENIEQVKSLRIYTKAMKDIAQQAKEHFETLRQTLTAQNDLSQRSGEFVRMLNSFNQVAELNEQKTPEQIEKAISEMIAASQEYIKKNDGLFKSTDGRNRLNAAKDMMRLGTHAQNQLIYGKKKDPITNESINRSKLCFDRNKRLADNQSAFAAACQPLDDYFASSKRPRLADNQSAFAAACNQPLDDYFASSNRPHLDDGPKEGQPKLPVQRRNRSGAIGKH